MVVGPFVVKVPLVVVEDPLAVVGLIAVIGPKAVVDLIEVIGPKEAVDSVAVVVPFVHLDVKVPIEAMVFVAVAVAVTVTVAGDKIPVEIGSITRATTLRAPGSTPEMGSMSIRCMVSVAHL